MCPHPLGEGHGKKRPYTFAPLWAALIARIDQGLGVRADFINPVLYQRFAVGVLRDIKQGDIGAYAAGIGWDACTGLGSPEGSKLLNTLQGNHEARV